MSITRLIFGAALGFLLAQGVLYCIKRLLAWVQRDEVRSRVRTFTPPPARAIVHASLKYAPLLGAAAAVITLGVWATGDYFAAGSARGAAPSDVEPSGAPPVSHTPELPRTVAELAPATKPDSSTAAPVESRDPYADPDFKVQRRGHTGTRLSLKDTLVQRAEAKARAELLGEVREHQKRSQYDCEAADRAARYLKAGLDVWGFAAWQIKHFPMDSYEGATLSQCRHIKEVVDPSRFDLHETIALGNDPGRVLPRDSRDGKAVVPTDDAGKSRQP